MRISIKYEASWRNSFLDGSNNEPLPNGGRGFVGSMTKLDVRQNKQFLNFKKREITIDTVMGVLNRLIGDQRKLYQSRANEHYFFSDIEDRVSFEDKQDKTKPINTEIVYIRNITGSTDQSGFTGMIKSNNPIFCSAYSASFWGVLDLTLQDLCDFVIEDKQVTRCVTNLDPLSILTRLNDIKAVNKVGVNDNLTKVAEIFSTKYPAFKFTKDAQGRASVLSFYCSALYLQMERLENKLNINIPKSPQGLISGISKNEHTPKDFMKVYTTGAGKPIWGNPYILKEKRKGEGEVTSMLTKANGTLEIILDISQDKAQKLGAMIETAGVSSFYLGKKGLAYVDSIRI